jgi:hypothetical protein
MEQYPVGFGHRGHPLQLHRCSTYSMQDTSMSFNSPGNLP